MAQKSSFMALLALCLLLLGACGNSTTLANAPSTNQTEATSPEKQSSSGKPIANRLQITLEPLDQDNAQTTLVEQADVVQRIHQAAIALPVMPEQQPCPRIAGPRYELTFYQDETQLFTLYADRGGCQTVQFSADDIRLANIDFWDLLDDAIASNR